MNIKFKLILERIDDELAGEVLDSSRCEMIVEDRNSEMYEIIFEGNHYLLPKSELQALNYMLSAHQTLPEYKK